MVRWLDNKPVTLACNVFGGTIIGNIKRWDKRSKSHIDVNIPETIKEYNATKWRR